MKRQVIKIFLLFSLMGFLLGTPDLSNAQCAMCKKSAEDATANEDSRIASSINSGVLYLLAMPYLAAGVIGFIWYRKQKVGVSTNN